MGSENVLMAEPHETMVNTGVKRNERAKLAKLLEKSLANSYMLYVKTQGIHWNVVGPLFYSLHQLTETQYQDLAAAIDEIAERIRSIGFLAPGSMQQFREIGDLTESTTTETSLAMIEQLVDDNETCARIMREAVVEAERVSDVKTADLLTDRIGQHEQNSWMLRAMLG